MPKKKTTPTPTPAEAAPVDAFEYRPAGGHFAPGLRPGDTVKVKNSEHRAQLDASPCFTPVRNESSSTTPPEGVDGGE